MLSDIKLLPGTMLNKADIGCWTSVGNPGYGAVFTLTPFRSPSTYTLTLSSPSSTIAPISISFAAIDSKCFGITFFIVTSPLVAAAAIINVPASIWSGITL